MAVAPWLIPKFYGYFYTLLFNFPVNFINIIYFNGKIHSLPSKWLMKKRLLRWMVRKQKAQFRTLIGSMHEEVKLILKRNSETQHRGVKVSGFLQFFSDNS